MRRSRARSWLADPSESTSLDPDLPVRTEEDEVASAVDEVADEVDSVEDEAVDEVVSAVTVEAEAASAVTVDEAAEVVDEDEVLPEGKFTMRPPACIVQKLTGAVVEPELAVLFRARAARSPSTKRFIAFSSLCLLIPTSLISFTKARLSWAYKGTCARHVEALPHIREPVP